MDSPRRAAAPPPPTWEQSLGSLVGPARASDRADAAPIGIELTVAATPGRPSRDPAVEHALKVVARLVTPGRNGWVAGGLAWSKLTTPYHYTEYRTSHVRLLRELYAVYRSHESAHSYGYYSEQKAIDLAMFESRQLWPLLDEAAAIGVRLVHGRKRLGPLKPYGDARLFLDVARGTEPESLVISPVLQVSASEVDAAPLRFIGSDGHGVVYVDRAQIRAGAEHGDWRLRLARLPQAVPSQVQRMAVANQHVEVPAGQGDRFRDEFYPRLRHVARVVSSDGSFTRPRSPIRPWCCARTTARTMRWTWNGNGRTRSATRRCACRSTKRTPTTDTGTSTRNRLSWPPSISRWRSSACATPNAH
jgi:hypothetical protein